MKQTKLNSFFTTRDNTVPAVTSIPKDGDTVQDAIIMPDDTHNQQSHKKRNAKTIALLRKRHNIKNLDGLNYSPCDQAAFSSLNNSLTTMPPSDIPCVPASEPDMKSPPPKKTKLILKPREIKSTVKPVEYNSEEKEALDDILQGLNAKPTIQMRSANNSQLRRKVKSQMSKPLNDSSNNHAGIFDDSWTDLGNDSTNIFDALLSNCQEKDFRDDTEISNKRQSDLKSPIKEFQISSENQIPDEAANILSESFSELFNSSFHLDEPPKVHERKFDRCEVIDCCQSNKQEVNLKLMNILDKRQFNLNLKGFWTNTRIKSGDICHVMNAKVLDPSTMEINDCEGYLVVTPDLLLSGTNVVQSMACQRRSILQHFFGAAESFGGVGNNKAMFIGTLVHLLFQKIVLLNSADLSSCQEIVNLILKQSQFVLDMYAIGLSEKAVRTEIELYLPQLLNWLSVHRDKARDKEPILCGVSDIEENIWSAQFGVKGKVDLTVEVKEKELSSLSRTIPMELKTGKSSFSSEHHGQVILYAMMMSDRLDREVEDGWLVYLKDGKSKLVSARHPEKRGLLQLRNELVAQMKAVFPNGSAMNSSFKDLPPVINNLWMCSRCPFITECSVFDRETAQQRNNSANLSPELRSLFSSSLTHLTDDHIDYFIRWCRLLILEFAEQEIGGECSVKRILDLDNTKESISPVTLNEIKEFQDSFLLKFDISQSQTGSGQFAFGEPIIVSTEDGRQMAITMASVYHVDHTNITIISDRKIDVNLGPFRIDKYHSSKISLINFAVLSRLVVNQPVCKKIRELIIDKRPPTFHKTLSKSKVTSVKHILKLLNSVQRNCILKCLMAEDYLLLKGYPGTGKTSTIVALIRVLITLGQRVLLSSYTHSSVDNVLMKLLPYTVDILRLGRSNRTRDELKCYCLEENLKQITDPDALKQFLKSKKVIATTCLSSGHPCLTHLDFDVVIIDEAGQILQPTCIAPLLSMGSVTAEEKSTPITGKFILVGDTKQLPPLVRNEQAKSAGLGMSLLEFLEDVPNSSCELNLQYRMNSVIVGLCNHLIYQGAVKCATAEVAGATIGVTICSRKYLLPNLAWSISVCSPKLEDSVIFLDTSEVCQVNDLFVTKNAVNKGEAQLTVFIVRQLLQFDIDPADIGIIAPYRNQVSHLSDLLRVNLFHATPKTVDLPVEVNTVDQYQGRDKSIIIISFTKSYLPVHNHKDQTVQSMSSDILSDIRRLNVAISRSKHKLILIGCRETLCKYESMLKLFAGLNSQQISRIKMDDSILSIIQMNSSI